MTKRKLIDIEAAKTLSGQIPYITEIKFKNLRPTEIIGNITHGSKLTRAHWDPNSGVCKVQGKEYQEHNLIFPSLN